MGDSAFIHNKIVSFPWAIVRVLARIRILPIGRKELDLSDGSYGLAGSWTWIWKRE